MDISSIFNIAKSGLSASQTALATISHNISNANTEGYSRQEAVLETAKPIPTDLGLFGNGVTVSQIRSYNDKFLEKRIIGKNSDLGYQQTVSQRFGEIEGVLSEDTSGLSSSLTAFYNAWSELSVDPTGESARTGVVSAGESLAGTIRNMYQELKGMQIEANNNVRQTVLDINTLTERIADLNRKIFQAGNGSATANDYIDERTRLLKDLSGKLDVQVIDDENSRVTVLTSSGKLLVDIANSYGLEAVVDEETGFYGVSRTGSSGEGTDITADISGGTLKGYLDVRDTRIPEFINGLDELARGVMETVNYFHASGQTLAGDTDVPFFKGITENYAKNIALSDQVKASVKNVAAGTSPGDNDIALKIASLGEGDLIYTTARSQVFADTGAALGVTGTMVINGQGLDIAETDSLEDIASAINTGLSGVSALIDAGRLVVSSLGGRATVTLVDASSETSGGLLDALGFGSGGVGFTAYIADSQARVGNYTKAATDSAEYESDIVQALKSQRESVSGVSLDEELANMIKYQYAYQASARLITLADEMLQTLLEM